MIRNILASAACALLMTVGANAATVQHDNLASFNAAAGATSLEDLNAATPGSLTGTSLALTDLTLDGTATTGFNSIADGGNVDGSRAIRGIGTGGAVFSMVFNNPIFSFAVDLFGVNDFAERTQIVVDGTTYSMPVVQGNLASFFGLTSTTAFSRVDFVILSGGEDADIDNIRYGDTAVIPLPASLPLLLGAFAVLGVARRRATRA